MLFCVSVAAGAKLSDWRRKLKDSLKLENFLCDYVFARRRGSSSSRAGMVARAPPPREYLGLENPTAANHCFLNAALQVLWSLGPFRERLLAAPCAAGERGELVAALHALFTRYARCRCVLCCLVLPRLTCARVTRNHYWAPLSLICVPVPLPRTCRKTSKRC